MLKETLLKTNLFENNDYLDSYVNLIETNRSTPKQKGRTQRHHIIPKAYYDLNNLSIDNSNENLVNLLYKDHILAHYYLACASRDSSFRVKMIFAINFILGNSLKYRIDLDEDLTDFVQSLDNYQELYENSIKLKAEQTAKKLRGRPRDQATRDKISNSSMGRSPSPEARKKMSEAKIGTTLSEETRKKISAKNKGKKQPWAGRKQSPEEIERRRQKLIGHKTSEETKRKISEKNTGKTRTEETKRKLSMKLKGRSVWNIGLESTIKGKRAIFNIRTGVVQYVCKEDIPNYIYDGSDWILGNPKAGRKNGKGTRDRKVLCIETGIIYSSLKEASTNKGCSCLYRSMKDINITTNKQHWVYLDKLFSIDLEVVGFEEGDNRHQGRLGALLVNYKDNIVKVGSGFSDELRDEIWHNRDEWLGRTVVVQYFEETRNANGGISLRFPVYIDYRMDL